MIQKYRSLPDFALRQILSAVRGENRRAQIGVIGGVDGPTAVFLARGSLRGKDRGYEYDNGALSFTPDLPAIGRALALAAAFLLAVAAVSAFLIRRVGRWK